METIKKVLLVGGVLLILQLASMFGMLVSKVVGGRYGVYTIAEDGTKRVPNGTQDVIVPPPIPRQPYAVYTGQPAYSHHMPAVTTQGPPPQASPSPCDGRPVGCGRSTPVVPLLDDGFRPIEVLPREP